MKVEINQALSPLASPQYERKSFLSKSGYEVTIAENLWALDKDVSFRLDSLSGLISDDLCYSFRQVLAFYAETCSAKHVGNIFYIFKLYFKFATDDTVFTPESIISFRSHLADAEWRISNIRAFVRTWVSLGYEGIPKETLAVMEKWTIKGNEKGYAVQSMCPEDGPLTDIEMDGVVSAVMESYASGALELRETAYAMVLAMTGRRPVQITALKIKDIFCIGDKYFIDMPRGKQRHAKWRAAFKRIPIVEDLYILLRQQAASVKEHFESELTGVLPPHLIPELPLFPNLREPFCLEDIEGKLTIDILHASSGSVSDVMRALEYKIAVISERTGAITHLNPARFRYTLGTNLAREGRGEMIIAEALDHSDLQNAGVYVRNIPDIVERIDKAVALRLAPIAQAFQGVLVKNESDARRGSDRSSRICSSGGNVGSCGSYGFCSASAPFACYTCSHFQPWLDGPHEFLLDQLISERDSVFDSTGDLKIASINDRLILAVSDVVARCDALKREPASV